MKNPDISVIVPIYNVEKYLERCVDSILKQTFCNIEVILVDDGSPDNCGNICEQYALQDTRVKVIHKANGGLSSARNAGIDCANGSYVSFVDSDDWIDADMLELLYSVMLKCNAEIVECSFRNVYEDHVIEETSCTAECIEVAGRVAIAEIMKWGHFKPMVWNKLYAYDVLKDIRFPVGKFHEDEYTTYKYFYNAQRLVSIDVSKYNYDRCRTNSITAQKFNINHLDACSAFRERIDFVRKHHLTELEEAANNAYAWSVLDRLYNAYKAKIHGVKISQTIKQIEHDLPYFQTRPMSADFLSDMQ